RPIPRKWLALSRTADAERRFVSPGTILMTVSGSVGRSTLATDALDGMLVSHDLLRIEPNREENAGWIYAFLRTPQARAMLSSVQYGHIIKHLEVPHVASIPIPHASLAVERELAAQFARVLSLRNERHRLTLEAESLFAEALGVP